MATEPAASAEPIAHADMVRADGYGPVSVGMTVAQAEAALGEELSASSEDCQLLAPRAAGSPPAWRWMVSGGVLVRIDVAGEGVVARGGGRVGMDIDALRAAYPGAVDQGPAKYDPQARTWIVGAAEKSHFVFEIGADGRVTQWRAGRSPEVDWVERCG